jgi:hypothetical protein
MRIGGQVEMGSIPAMAAKPRTSLAEAKRASVIEAPRNSLGHLVAEDLRRPTGVAAQVARVEHKPAVAGDALVEDMRAAAEVGQAEAAAVVGAAAAVVGVDSAVWRDDNGIWSSIMIGSGCNS